MYMYGIISLVPGDVPVCRVGWSYQYATCSHQESRTLAASTSRVVSCQYPCHRHPCPHLWSTTQQHHLQYDYNNNCTTIIAVSIVCGHINTGVHVQSWKFGPTRKSEAGTEIMKRVKLPCSMWHLLTLLILIWNNLLLTYSTCAHFRCVHIRNYRIPYQTKCRAQLVPSLYMSLIHASL